MKKFITVYMLYGTKKPGRVWVGWEKATIGLTASLFSSLVNQKGGGGGGGGETGLNILFPIAAHSLLFQNIEQCVAIPPIPFLPGFFQPPSPSTHMNEILCNRHIYVVDYIQSMLS